MYKSTFCKRNVAHAVFQINKQCQINGHGVGAKVLFVATQCEIMVKMQMRKMLYAHVLATVKL